MNIDDSIEILRDLLNDKIAENKHLLTSKKIISISEELDRLLIECCKHGEEKKSGI